MRSNSILVSTLGAAAVGELSPHFFRVEHFVPGGKDDGSHIHLDQLVLHGVFNGLRGTRLYAFHTFRAHSAVETPGCLSGCFVFREGQFHFLEALPLRYGEFRIVGSFLRPNLFGDRRILGIFGKLNGASCGHVRAVQEALDRLCNFTTCRDSLHHRGRTGSRVTAGEYAFDGCAVRELVYLDRVPAGPVQPGHRIPQTRVNGLTDGRDDGVNLEQELRSFLGNGSASYRNRQAGPVPSGCISGRLPCRLLLPPLPARPNTGS